MKITRRHLLSLIQEALGKDTFGQIQEVIKSNERIADYADKITIADVHDLIHVYYVQLPGGLDQNHIARHFEDNPGSVWTIPKDEVFDMMLTGMDSKPPILAGSKLKWINVETGENVGVDAVISKDDLEGRAISTEADLERFGLVDRTDDWNLIRKIADDDENNYELVTHDGDAYTADHFKAHKEQQGDSDAGPEETVAYIKQHIGYVSGNKNDNPTQKINIITGKSGIVNGKPVVTLITIFPGIQPVDDSGKDITDKKLFAKQGYFFLKEDRIRIVERWQKLAGILKD